MASWDGNIYANKEVHCKQINNNAMSSSQLPQDSNYLGC